MKKNSDPGSGREKFGSGINIPDPLHCNNVLGLEKQCMN
jgi:hypothetical protein